MKEKQIFLKGEYFFLDNNFKKKIEEARRLAENVNNCKFQGIALNRFFGSLVFKINGSFYLLKNIEYDQKKEGTWITLEMQRKLRACQDPETFLKDLEKYEK